LWAREERGVSETKRMLMNDFIDLVGKSEPEEGMMLVSVNTVITCVNCGNEYEIYYSEPYGEGTRICRDCIEGDIT
jgi:hypothetical protein